MGTEPHSVDGKLVHLSQARPERIDVKLPTRDELVLEGKVIGFC